ncbi:hypothetical protein L596_026982 [Steinernema carpocapsae]|uniref:Uncharacterized protein n=1 Tax=Steinernema carpocapsae TaxID=34508 RepID=A0A4U5M316_STECR|nr:hypothetical protein L596_026982 [Steinernema carpocapsae]
MRWILLPALTPTPSTRASRISASRDPRPESVPLTNFFRPPPNHRESRPWGRRKWSFGSSGRPRRSSQRPSPHRGFSPRHPRNSTRWK